MVHPSINQIGFFIIAMLSVFIAKTFIFSSQSLLWETRAFSQLPHIFATKTTYHDSFKIASDARTAEQGDKVVLSKPIIRVSHDVTCQPIKVIGIYRHGTRYPTKKHINFAHTILDKLTHLKVDQSKLDSLQSVLDNHILPEYSGQLAKLGQQEHEKLGFRTRKRFRNLFDSEDNEVKFFSSSVKRAEESLQAYYRAFYDTDVNTTDFEVRDDLLRFHENCPEYSIHIKKNKTALKEHFEFLKEITPKVNQVIGDSLNLEGPLNLTDDEIMAWVNIAAAELAIVRSNFWIKCLDQEILHLLEYAVDLEQYYLTGYGYMLNYEMSCPLFSHVFHQMDKALEHCEVDCKKNAGLFYFAHAETLNPLMALFGFYKDNKTLRADNFLKMKNRFYRTSLISPFANNLQMILYKCSNSQPEFMIQFLHKEQPILIDELSSQSRYGLYPYQQVRDKYKVHIDRCHFNSMCKV